MASPLLFAEKAPQRDSRPASQELNQMLNKASPSFRPGGPTPQGAIPPEAAT